MRTLYLRNVPDEVAERLERLAAAEGLSRNALAVRELTDAARRADDARLLSALSDLDLDVDEIVDVLRDAREAGDEE